MKKTWTKVLAVICAAAMVLSFAACSKKGTDETTSTTGTTAAGETTTGDATQADETTTDAGTTKEGETTTAGSTKDGEPAPKPVAGGTYQNTSDKAVVLNAYKTAAKASSSLKKSQVIKINSASLNNGNIPGLIMGIVNKVAAKNSVSLDPGAPGNWGKLTANDLSSASMSVNGNTATITLNAKTQTDGKKGDWGSGSVGHLIGVLSSIDEVIEQIPGAKQASDGTASLTYKNAQVKVTIDTKTNKMQSGTAQFTVDASATKVGIKAGPISLDNKAIKASVSYQVKLG